MDNFNVTPMLFQVLCNKPAVAAVRFILAAKQTAARDDLFRNGPFDLPLTHQRDESVLVGCPIATPFPVVVQQLLRRGQRGQVNVLHPAELAQEKREVVLLRKTGQLRPIIEPHVDDSPCRPMPAAYRKSEGRALSLSR